MTKNQREAILLIDTPYRPDPGYFSYPKNIIGGRYVAGQWFGCREIWHYELKNLPLFFFSHSTGKTRSIDSFMRKIEDGLEVRPISHFGPTQRKTISWIEPSPWWTRLAMRRSLFTILLRVSDHYHPEEDNFDQALYSHKYTRETQYAVERFLSGCTHYKGRKRGWYNQFAVLKPTISEIDALLI
jgi:hypothetical protein